MSLKVISKFLDEFKTLSTERKMLFPNNILREETESGIKAIIESAPKIKSGELKIADIVQDVKVRANVYSNLDNYAPSTKEYLNIQKQIRPITEARKTKTLEDVKDYIETNINALTKGKGNFENLLNDRAAEALEIHPETYLKYKKLAGFEIPKELESLYNYFKQFATSEKFKRISGQTNFTPNVVEDLRQESLFRQSIRSGSPEELIAKFLYRSHNQPGSDVKLLNKSKIDISEGRKTLKQMQFKIGGRKITFEDIKKGLAENDPLFAEVKEAYDYKNAVLKTKVMNPKTGMLESLNKAAFDVIGKSGYDLFHMSHIYDVGRTPLSFLQITFGPYNLQMHNMLKAKKIPGGVENFLTRAKAVNLANPFAPDFIKKSPKAFAEEAVNKLNEFYKLQKKNKSITFNKFIQFNKGGIVGLQKVN